MCRAIHSLIRSIQSHQIAALAPAIHSLIRPYMQLPILTFRGTPIVESTVINDFIDGAFPGPSLQPLSPLDQAVARNTIDHFTSLKLMPLFYRMLSHKEHFESIRDLLLETLRDMDGRMRRNGDTGPYWFGEQFTLVDLALFPFIDRCDIGHTCLLY